MEKEVWGKKCIMCLCRTCSDIKYCKKYIECKTICKGNDKAVISCHLIFPIKKKAGDI